jgi:hypothetical protein
VPAALAMYRRTPLSFSFTSITAPLVGGMARLKDRNQEWQFLDEPRAKSWLSTVLVGVAWMTQKRPLVSLSARARWITASDCRRIDSRTSGGDG